MKVFSQGTVNQFTLKYTRWSLESILSPWLLLRMHQRPNQVNQSWFGKIAFKLLLVDNTTHYLTNNKVLVHWHFWRFSYIHIKLLKQIGLPFPTTTNVGNLHSYQCYHAPSTPSGHFSIWLPQGVSQLRAPSCKACAANGKAVPCRRAG